MNRENEHEDLIELGSASEETKGGPWGVDDFRAGLMIGGAGLTQDDVINLGAASVETRGTPFGSDDHKAGLIPVAGLSDE